MAEDRRVEPDEDRDDGERELDERASPQAEYNERDPGDVDDGLGGAVPFIETSEVGTSQEEQRSQAPAQLEGPHEPPFDEHHPCHASGEAEAAGYGEGDLVGAGPQCEGQRH